jgi:hypothetical protein
MMIDIYVDTAFPPSFAKAASSFQRDDTCAPVFYVVGTEYDEVYNKTRELFTVGEMVDYDVNWSAEAEKYVGVVVKNA